MKLKKVLLAGLMLIVLGTTIVFATEADVPTTTSLNSEVMPISEETANEIKIEENDYFVCEENVTLSNLRVMGNLFVVGSTVQMSDVHTTGSIFIVSENINMSEVFAEGSLYAVGASITTKSSVMKNIYTVSADIEISEGTMLEKNFYTVSEKCNFNATANNNVGIIGEEVNIGTESSVFGSLDISSSNEPEIPGDAVIENYNFNLVEENEKNIQSAFSISTAVAQVIAYVVSTVIIALVVLKCNPNIKEKTQKYEIKNFAKNALIGLLLVIVLPIVAIIAMCTGIGIRLGFILLLIYIIAFMIATPLVCVLIGLMISEKKNITETKNIILNITIVSLIVAILGVIPTLGGLITIILGLVGFGTMFVLPFSKRSEVKDEIK